MKENYDPLRICFITHMDEFDEKSEQNINQLKQLQEELNMIVVECDLIKEQEKMRRIFSIILEEIYY